MSDDRQDPSHVAAAELIPPLKERHRRFALEYVIDLNGSGAARRPEVQLAIRAEMKERDQRLRLTSDATPTPSCASG